MDRDAKGNVIRLFGSTCGLIVFSATILVGLATGAEPAALIPRAVQAMIGGVALGCVAGWLGMRIVRDGAPGGGVEEAATNGIAEPTGPREDVTVVGN